MKPVDDIARLRAEYENRKRRFSGNDQYSWFNSANLFTVQQRQRAVLNALKLSGISDLSNKAILEMGCGGGGVMVEYLGFGAQPENLYGLDLLFDRVKGAHHRLPDSHFVSADGQSLPLPSRIFDLALQYMALSSILDSEIRLNFCTEMLRVLKTDGLILSYDFWLNPTNKQTRGLRPIDIQQLFPNCDLTIQRITLAPPITRRLATVSWGLCLFLESVKVFNSHYLIVIRPNA